MIHHRQSEAINSAILESLAAFADRSSKQEGPESFRFSGLNFQKLCFPENLASSLSVRTNIRNLCQLNQLFIFRSFYAFFNIFYLL